MRSGSGCWPRTPAGDEVIVPALTFIATFEAVTQVGATPVVVDVQESDYNIDPGAVEAAVTSATLCLLPVHLYGQMADMRALRELAERRRLLILEDACQAHGAERDGSESGVSRGDGGVQLLSLEEPRRHGGRGRVRHDDDELAERVRMLREHGQVSRTARRSRATPPDSTPFRRWCSSASSGT